MVYNRIIKIFNFQFSFFFFITQVRHNSLISRFLMQIRMLIERFCTVFLCCFKQAHNNSFFRFSHPWITVFLYEEKIFRKEIIAIFVTKEFRSFRNFFRITVTRSILVFLLSISSKSCAISSFVFFFSPITTLSYNSCFDFAFVFFFFSFSLDRRLYKIGRCLANSRYLFFFDKRNKELHI
jgi:hypothetical protein